MISLFRYKYSKDDEEIYKEFMEINNELIPHILKADGRERPPAEKYFLTTGILFRKPGF